MLELLRRLFDYDRWANRRVIESLRIAGTTDSRLSVLLAHICGSKKMWLGRINANEDAQTNTWPDLSPEDSSKLLELLDEMWSNLLAALEEGDLAREIDYITADGKPGMQTLGDIIAHSMLHSQYHRGQLSARVRELGGTPASTDFVVWTRALREGLAD